MTISFNTALFNSPDNCNTTLNVSGSLCSPLTLELQQLREKSPICKDLTLANEINLLQANLNRSPNKDKLLFGPGQLPPHTVLGVKINTSVFSMNLLTELLKSVLRQTLYVVQFLTGAKRNISK